MATGFCGHEAKDQNVFVPAKMQDLVGYHNEDRIGVQPLTLH